MKTRTAIIMNLLFCASLFLLVPTFPALGGEPSKEPILRLETGMHTTQIRRIGVDAANRFLVTASDDKTVRLWELPGLRLVKTLRPPVGEGSEGKIYAVAFSPDGNTIAATGWTSWEWDEKASIYLFDRASGRMSRPKGLQELPYVISHLAYSRDGKYLVACLMGAYGIRIYRTTDYSLVKQDTEYGDNSYGADFSRDGRLVTVSYDGFIRLYDQSFTRIGKMQAPGGKKPFSVSFSPDGEGTKIAVGYHDTTRVDVLSGRDLSYLFSPDTYGVDNGNLLAVAWSTDGSLFAGGRYTRNAICPIFQWADGGQGLRKVLPASGDTIMQILPLRDGGMVFGAADPACGIIDRNGKRTRYTGPEIADFRDTFERFLVSHDGAAVQFGFEQFGKFPARFSIAKRLLTPDPIAPGAHNPPVTKAAGLEITDWYDKYEPKLNGKLLKLDQDEMSRSRAICPGGQCFLLGTEWFLRLFDTSGAQKWGKPVPIPGVAWSVNITGDGKVAVAALGDGTVRWYRMTDGKELLAFFPHKDKKRWVLWTPSGYYDASIGGEDLIGWHINRGPDQAADFFPVSRFRDIYYRPDIIARVLTILNEEEAVRLANAVRGIGKEAPIITKVLPPVVTIDKPPEGTISTTSNTITIRYQVRSPSDAPVTSVQALVNTRPVPTPKGVPVKTRDKSYEEITVTIPEKDCEIALIAKNRNASSEPDTIRIIWQGRKPGTPPLRRLLILAVGIRHYEDKALKLDYAAKDAEDFLATFKQQEGILYSKVVPYIVTSKAKLGDIIDGLVWLENEATNKDTVAIFLSGHGDTRAGVFYFLPQDAVTDNLSKTGLRFSRIKDTVASLPSDVLIFLDACRAGSVDLNGIVNTLTDTEVGAMVFTSSKASEKSLELPEWKNGAFTRALVEGLGGKADLMNTGEITFKSLDTFVTFRVKQLTEGKQTPDAQRKHKEDDFLIAKRLKKSAE